MRKDANVFSHDERSTRHENTDSDVIGVYYVLRTKLRITKIGIVIPSAPHPVYRARVFKTAKDFRV